jgi:hypothetical protein
VFRAHRATSKEHFLSIWKDLDQFLPVGSPQRKHVDVLFDVADHWVLGFIGFRFDLGCSTSGRSEGLNARVKQRVATRGTLLHEAQVLCQFQEDMDDAHVCIFLFCFCQGCPFCPSNSFSFFDFDFVPQRRRETDQKLFLLSLERVPTSIRPFCKAIGTIVTTEICRKVLRNTIEGASLVVTEPASTVIAALCNALPTSLPPHLPPAPLHQHELKDACVFAIADRIAPPDFVEEDAAPDLVAEDASPSMHFQCVSLLSQLPHHSTIEKVRMLFS